MYTYMDLYRIAQYVSVKILSHTLSLRITLQRDEAISLTLLYKDYRASF